MSKRNVENVIALDVLRSLAIISMVSWHFVGFMSDNASGAFLVPFKNTIYYIGSYLSVPSFLLCSGISSAYTYCAKVHNGIGKYSISTYNIKKGLVLFILGILYTSFIHGLDSVFYMWILQCIGLCIVFMAFFNDKRAFLVVSVITLLLAFPFIQQVLFGLTGTRKYLLEEITIYRLFESMFVSGNFALIPWITIYMYGMLIGGYLFEDINSHTKKLTNFIYISIAMIVCGVILNTMKSVTIFSYDITVHITKYPASLSYILLFTGISTIVFLGSYKIFNELKYSLPYREFITLYSKMSLSVFCIHYAFGLVFVCKGLGCLTNNPVIGFASSILFLWSLYYFMRYWEKYHFKYSLEYIVKNVVRGPSLKKL